MNYSVVFDTNKRILKDNFKFGCCRYRQRWRIKRGIRETKGNYSLVKANDQSVDLILFISTIVYERVLTDVVLTVLGARYGTKLVQWSLIYGLLAKNFKAIVCRCGNDRLYPLLVGHVVLKIVNVFNLFSFVSIVSWTTNGFILPKRKYLHIVPIWQKIIIQDVPWNIVIVMQDAVKTIVFFFCFFILLTCPLEIMKNVSPRAPCLMM